MRRLGTILYSLAAGFLAPGLCGLVFDHSGSDVERLLFGTPPLSLFGVPSSPLGPRCTLSARVFLCTGTGVLWWRT
jgi:hypothetical protein